MLGVRLHRDRADRRRADRDRPDRERADRAPLQLDRADRHRGEDCPGRVARRAPERASPAAAAGCERRAGQNADPRRRRRERNRRKRNIGEEQASQLQEPIEPIGIEPIGIEPIGIEPIGIELIGIEFSGAASCLGCPAQEGLWRKDNKTEPNQSAAKRIEKRMAISDDPNPPWICMFSSAARTATSDANNLAAAASWVYGLPASLRAAAR